MPASEIRNWIQFSVLLVGGVIGLFAFFQNMKQRKIENAIKLTNWFHESISKDELKSWEHLFKATSEPAGAKYGHYATVDGQRPLSDFFSEGSEDNGAVGRISDCLEVICYELCSKTVDARFVWFELGQLLTTIHGWIGSIEGHSENKSLLEESFPSFNKAFIKYEKKFNKWPSRTYAYIE
jgi:hypothetical protein